VFGAEPPHPVTHTFARVRYHSAIAVKELTFFASAGNPSQAKPSQVLVLDFCYEYDSAFVFVAIAASLSEHFTIISWR